MSDARNLTAVATPSAVPAVEEEEDRRPTLIGSYVESAMGIRQVGAGVSVTNNHLATGNELHQVTNATLADSNDLHKTTNTTLADGNDLHKTTNATLTDGNELHKTTNEHLATGNDLRKAANATLVDGNELHRTTNEHLAAGNGLHETTNTALDRANALQSAANDHAHRAAVALEQVHAVLLNWSPPPGSLRAQLDELSRRHQEVADQVARLQHRQTGDEVVGDITTAVTQDQMSELRAMFSDLQNQVVQLRNNRTPENPGGGSRPPAASRQRPRQ